MAFPDFALAMLIAFPSCKPAEPPAPPAAAHDDAASAERRPTLTSAVLVGDTRVRVRVARTDAQRQRGLMFVQNLPMDEGMLFLFDSEEVQGFWMKNTLISLDMIFIRTDMTVAGVVADAPPLTLDTRSVGKPSQYVLEVNAGFARAHAIAEGAKVTFENVPGYTPRP